MALFSRPLSSLFVRFLLSGGAATGLHWALMAVCVAFQMPAVAATALGAAAGAALNYGLQYQFTFRSHVQHQRALPAYLLVSALAWLVNAGLFAALNLALHLQAAVAQVLTSAAVALLNFVLYKRVVFDECSRPRLVT